MKKPFQIGERVCATYPGGKYIGEVVKSNDQFTSILGDNGTGFNMFETYMVRRLKPKKKPREWQIVIYENHQMLHQANTKVNLLHSNGEIVRVREVL